MKTYVLYIRFNQNESEHIITVVRWRMRTRDVTKRESRLITEVSVPGQSRVSRMSLMYKGMIINVALCTRIYEAY